MSKIKVSELKCFDQVAGVIGEAKAGIELFKVLSVAKKCSFDDQLCVLDSFTWVLTPQGDKFWNSIDDGINPYDN
ncbi:conserved hypothetical protein [Vibrio phage 381E49-1]|nr:conserved hypothetical protein [Vibrio phage 381E49-1]